VLFRSIALTLSPGNAAGLVMHGVRAYVHNCTAMEKRPDAEFIQMQLRFLLLDAEQQRQLSSIVAESS
jgi:hypothetical protein